MREVDEANTESKRLHIIRAAARCLAENGVSRTSISDICREAGMRSGHLYYYFANKEAILRAVYLLNLESRIEEIEHMLDAADLGTALIDIHDRAETNRRAYGLTAAVRFDLECYFVRDSGFEEEAVADVKGRLMGAIRKGVEGGIARGTLRPDVDIDTLIDAIVLIWNGLSHSRLDRDFDLEAMGRAVRVLVQPWTMAHREALPGKQRRTGTG